MYMVEVESATHDCDYPRVLFPTFIEAVEWLTRQHVPGGHRALRADVHRLLSPGEESLFTNAPKDTRVARLRWTREKGWEKVWGP